MNYIEHKKKSSIVTKQKEMAREKEKKTGKKMEKAQSQHSMETPPPNATSSNIQ